MSEQSNKPSPQPARAASQNTSASEPRKPRPEGQTRAPMTQTRDGELQTDHAGSAEQRGPRRAPAPRSEAGQRPAQNGAKPSRPQGERPPREEARTPPFRNPIPPIAFPEELPVSSRRAEIAKAVSENQVVIVSGETGSGKTTQLPKICLELGRGQAGRQTAPSGAHDDDVDVGRGGHRAAASGMVESRSRISAVVATSAYFCDMSKRFASCTTGLRS